MRFASVAVLLGGLGLLGTSTIYRPPAEPPVPAGVAAALQPSQHGDRTEAVPARPSVAEQRADPVLVLDSIVTVATPVDSAVLEALEVEADARDEELPVAPPPELALHEADTPEEPRAAPVAAAFDAEALDTVAVLVPIETRLPDTTAPSEIIPGDPAGQESGPDAPSLADAPQALESAPEALPAALAASDTAAAEPAETSQPASAAAAHVDQIASAERSLVHVPQLHEPDSTPGQRMLVQRTDAMQISLPRQVEQRLVALQAEAPSEINVRLGQEALGTVAIRMTGAGSMDIQLSSLLEVLKDRFEPVEFAQLHTAAAADAFVPLETLRDAGIGVHYDPVYDELVVGA